MDDEPDESAKDEETALENEETELAGEPADDDTSVEEDADGRQEHGDSGR